ncbi:MAG: GAF domain-containing protein [Planctomycetota bacterium]|jgi:GAF domain-containing protein
MTKQEHYDRLFERLDALCDGETDRIALMSTLTCELRHEFDRFDWVGFYRSVGGEVLKIGPYQGAHGCLTIPFSKGVCGKCAREKATQIVPDVTKVEDHIACSATTRSEIVVPILDASGGLLGVLDIDSDQVAAFDEVDGANLERIGSYFRKQG